MIQQRVLCRATLDSRAAVISAAGAASMLAIACDDTDRTIRAPVPGSGPLYLAFEHDVLPDRPQWLPTSLAVSWVIDSISFE